MRPKKATLWVVVALLGMGTATWAQGDVSYEVSGGFFTHYIWRGQTSTDDWVFQPDVSASWNGFTAGIWGNLDVGNDNGRDGSFTEYDYYLDYSGQFTEMLGYSVGGIYYYFPGGDATAEVYGGVNVDCVANPALTVYWDFDEVGGIYANFAVSHSLEYWPDLPFGIDLGASIGWGDGGYNDDYWGTAARPKVGSELNDLVLSAAFPFEVGAVTVTPSVTYVSLLGSDVRKSDAYDTDNDVVVAGVTASYNF